MAKHVLDETLHKLIDQSYNDYKRNSEDLNKLMDDFLESRISKSEYKEQNRAIRIRVKELKDLLKEIKQIAKQIKSLKHGKSPRS